MILPRECLTMGSQERRAWVSTQTRRTQHMLKMQQIKQLFAKCTSSMLHPKWVLPYKGNPLKLVMMNSKIRFYLYLLTSPYAQEGHVINIYMPMRYCSLSSDPRSQKL